MPTERLYYTDSALLEFTARVIDLRPDKDRVGVVLDRTAFYPTGGGQPNDIGSLNGVDVLDVIENDDGTVFHFIGQVDAMTAGKEVQGRVDHSRRIDHMQQHSGQHILSQAFVQSCGAQTRSFHLGSSTSTIDIELAAPTDDHMRAAEKIANNVVFEDRPMRVHIVDEAEAERLPLRKESAVRGLIRVIEVEDFDWSPCGGTHANRTGQVGLIAIKSFERAKKLTRVEFVCGWRALADYLVANKTAFAVARLFSAERDTTPDLVSKAIAESKALKRRIRELLEITVAGEAARLVTEAKQIGSLRLVSAVFQGRDMDELRLLASNIVGLGQAAALLGSNDGGTARLVFARSADVAGDVSKLLAEACSLVGGRGGGNAQLAQGGGPNADKLDDAIRSAAARIGILMEGGAISR